MFVFVVLGSEQLGYVDPPPLSSPGEGAGGGMTMFVLPRAPGPEGAS